MAERVGYAHPDGPKDVLEEMAGKALASTEDARIQGLRVPLAQHEVADRAVAWEPVWRDRGSGPFRRPS
jgi:hypothetical protein